MARASARAAQCSAAIVDRAVRAKGTRSMLWIHSTDVNASRKCAVQ